VYARGESQIIPKLRGTFAPTATATTEPQNTDLQKSIFNAPPPGIPTKPIENGVKSGAAGPQGLKRPREEEEEEAEESDAPMEEDEDDAEMDEDED